ncbi:MAG: hypothetical protein ISS91_04825 [Candidatus Omnitrophica bacterium]|nr:hypothetical protein [Candidatus Omnitrophota bacterium]
MRILKKSFIFGLAVSVWFVLWVNFLVRDLFTKGQLAEHVEFLKASRHGKYEIVYGKRFFEFLTFVNESIPRGSDYNFRGVEPLSLEWRRGVYYLYPLMMSEDAEYLLVFEKPGYSMNGYKLFRKFDNGRFILKRK